MIWKIMELKEAEWIFGSLSKVVFERRILNRRDHD